MNNSGVFIERTIPDYIFRKKYKNHVFAYFEDVFCNNLACYLEALLSNRNNIEDKTCSVYSLDNGEQLDQSFLLRKEDVERISLYCKDRESDGIPYYAILARKIVITNASHEFCFYADRYFDICIIASDYRLFENEVNEECRNLNLLTNDQFLEYLKRLMNDDDRFTSFREKFIASYVE